MLGRLPCIQHRPAPCCVCVQALRQMGLEGVVVLDVPPGTPADKAGLQVGG